MGKDPKVTLGVSVFIFHWKSASLNCYMLLKIFFFFFGFKLKDWNWATVNFSAIWIFFSFSIIQMSFIFPKQAFNRSINRSQNPQTTVIPTFSCFSNVLYFNVCQSRIDSIFPKRMQIHLMQNQNTCLSIKKRPLKKKEVFLN